MPVKTALIGELVILRFDLYTIRMHANGSLYTVNLEYSSTERYAVIGCKLQYYANAGCKTCARRNLFCCCVLFRFCFKLDFFCDYMDTDLKLGKFHIGLPTNQAWVK